MEQKTSRRKLLKGIAAGTGSAAMVSLSGCSSGDNDNEVEGETIYSGPFTVTEDAVDLVPWQLATEEGLFAANGLDIDLTVAGYGEWARQLTTGDADLGSLNQAEYATSFQNDFQNVIFGSGLIQINDCFVLPDSDIEEPQDLEGQSVGFPFESSGTTLAFQTVLADEFGIDINEDLDATFAAPPALYEFVQTGELDACVQFTGQTIRGYASPDEVRPILDISELWRNRTGSSLEVTYWAAREDFFNSNPEAALSLVETWEDAVGTLAEDPADAFDRYGLLAGLSNEDEIAVARERFNEGDVFNEDAGVWDEDYLGAQFDFLELMEQVGAIDQAPSRELGVTHEELTSMVE